MLDQCEREVHDRLQRAGVRLKNETFAQLEPAKPLRLADILSPDEQALWVSVPGFIINDDERPLEGERTTRAQQMFDAFEAHPASFWMLRAMGRYVWRTIPNPRKSERRYWSVTLRTEADDHVSLRLNVGAQTVLDLVGGPNWETDVRIFVPRERFERALPFRLPTLRDRRITPNTKTSGSSTSRTMPRCDAPHRGWWKRARTSSLCAVRASR
jgi:hypothetical protein